MGRSAPEGQAAGGVGHDEELRPRSGRARKLGRTGDQLASASEVLLNNLHVQPHGAGQLERHMSGGDYGHELASSLAPNSRIEKTRARAYSTVGQGAWDPTQLATRAGTAWRRCGSSSSRGVEDESKTPCSRSGEQGTPPRRVGSVGRRCSTSKARAANAREPWMQPCAARIRIEKQAVQAPRHQSHAAAAHGTTASRG